MTDRLQTLLAFYEKQPDDTFATYAIAMEHRKAGDLVAAIEWFDRTIAIDAEHAYAHYHKAAVLTEQGDGAGALATAETGLTQAEAAGDQKAADELRELISTLQA